MLISRGDGEPCLAVLSELARSGRGQTADRRWQVLDRALARAVGRLAALSAQDRRPAPESLRAAEALCESIRSLGAPCGVYRP